MSWYNGKIKASLFIFACCASLSQAAEPAFQAGRRWGNHPVTTVLADEQRSQITTKVLVGKGGGEFIVVPVTRDSARNPDLLKTQFDGFVDIALHGDIGLWRGGVHAQPGYRDSILHTYRRNPGRRFDLFILDRRTSAFAGLVNCDKFDRSDQTRARTYDAARAQVYPELPADGIVEIGALFAAGYRGQGLLTKVFPLLFGLMAKEFERQHFTPNAIVVLARRDNAGILGVFKKYPVFRLIADGDEPRTFEIANQPALLMICDGADLRRILAQADNILDLWIQDRFAEINELLS